jgi:hypothetical protein
LRKIYPDGRRIRESVAADSVAEGVLTVPKAKCYRILVRGEFGKLLSTAFENVTVQPGQGETLLVTGHIDESALYGLLDRLRDFNVELVCLQDSAGGHVS